MKTRTYARVTMTVEVGVRGGWNADESVGYIHERSAKEGVDFVKAALAAAQVKVIGEPKVTMTIVESET